MPYLAVGKCVYKKKPDGSRGSLVGCTKGSVKNYLAALRMHADHKPTEGVTAAAIKQRGK
jgi:hypothetical protein